MIQSNIEVDEDRIFINDWIIEIHFWDKCFRCAKTGLETRWFSNLEEAVKHCVEV